MKLIVATVPADKWQAVYDALKDPVAHVMYVSGAGDLRESIVGCYRGATYREPRARTRLEIVVVNDLAVPDVIDAVSRVVWDPDRQTVTSGTIFVMPLDEWTDIRPTGPTGELEHHTTVHCTKQAS